MSEWEIWIDDLNGELAMSKTDLAKRKIEVVEKEDFTALQEKYEELLNVKECFKINRDSLAKEIDQLNKHIALLREHKAQDAKEIARLREALTGIIEIGKRDLTNPKYDGYFEAANKALKGGE